MVRAINTGTTYTAISSYWTVPSVVPSEANEASGTWIGIDGAISGDDSIIQTGTAQTTSGGSTSYYAWYELYPNASVELGVVAPGDEMEAEIEEDSPGTWTITIEDLTSQQGSTGQVPYDGPGESAEWIEEVPSGDPQPGLADFGNADFTDLGVTTTEPDDVVSTPTFMANSDGDIIAYPGGFVDDDMTVTYGQPPTATAVSASPNPTASGTSVTYSASVSSAYGPPDGSVTFSAGSTSLCTASLSNGSGSCTSSAAPVGTDTVSGTYPGDPVFAASTGSTTLVVNSPAASAPPPSHGYWLVGSDGGIFTFGSAVFHGSTGSLVLQRPVVGIVPTNGDGGYWLDASDGGVFSFGDTTFYGSIPGLGLHPAGSGLPNSLMPPLWAWCHPTTTEAISWWLPTEGSSLSGMPTLLVRAQVSVGVLAQPSQLCPTPQATDTGW